jgi:16S rRNA (uracil1498-N3)-methyltransferase
MSHRFYVNCSLQPGPIQVQGPEAHHLATVCRLHPGDAICLFNGNGHEYPATVMEVSRRNVLLDVLACESPQRELGFRLELAAPLPKGDRGQFLVEKLTELGVTDYIPLRTQRSVVHPGETRRDKLERHVIEASKQCGRNALLQIHPLSGWETYCAAADRPALRILAHPGAPQGNADATRTPGLALALAIGPEGGFAPDEIEIAQTAGWQVVSLGPRILRVETAALVLAAWAAGLRTLNNPSPAAP